MLKFGNNLKRNLRVTKCGDVGRGQRGSGNGGLRFSQSAPGRIHSRDLRIGIHPQFHKVVAPGVLKPGIEVREDAGLTFRSEGQAVKTAVAHSHSRRPCRFRHLWICGGARPHVCRYRVARALDFALQPRRIYLACIE